MCAVLGMDASVVKDLVCTRLSCQISSQGKEEHAITCHPIPDTSTERLIQEHRLDGCFPLQNLWCEVFEGGHRQNGVETESRNWGFVQRFCT